MEFTPIVTPGTKHFSMDSASSRSRFGCSFFLPHTSSTSNMARNFRDMNMYDSLSKLDEFCHFFHCCNLWNYFVNNNNNNKTFQSRSYNYNSFEFWMWWGLHWFHVMWNGSRAAAQPTNMMTSKAIPWRETASNYNHFSEVYHGFPTVSCQNGHTEQHFNPGSFTKHDIRST